MSNFVEEKKQTDGKAATDQPSTASKPDQSNQPDKSKEHGGCKGPEPTRYGDWEHNGRCTDF